MKKIFVITGEYSGDIHAGCVVRTLKKRYPDIQIEGIGGDNLKKEGVNLNRFEWIKPYAEITDGNKTVIASHYPTFCYNHQYQLTSDKNPRTYMLYGHVHNTHDEVLVNQFQELTRKSIVKTADGERKIPCNMINCFCKFSDYTPLSLKEWIELDAKRRAELKIPENQIL